ncbi:UdgX family uracil-DNA binding protein [Haloferula sargassicola]|uniref:Type-4 uracil-DNA glycosylase n=1 Tax=Haloferula sargassicola TaxID=490096 RepID=A0ABP9UXR7_9BACT
MRSIDPGNSFTTWRDAARALLAEGIPPGEILWEKDANLFALHEPEPIYATRRSSELKVPADFIDLAKLTACHADPTRWALLYRILWRITHGEPKLIAVTTDPDIARAQAMAENVRREIHKMHAFVRFRKVGENESGRERFAAWFEPDHYIVEAGTPFFRKRFATMDWAIFTPKGCAHWNGDKLLFTEGVDRDPFENTDQLEDAWRTYYSCIFNPARLKTKAMQAEMPKRYWKNLPEAGLIDSLIRDSRHRLDRMVETAPQPVRQIKGIRYLDELRQASEMPAAPATTTEEVARHLAACRQCPLWERATCAVPGEGPADARIMIVGEQPGDREDLEGRPFVGPAGQLLDRAMAEAGIDRAQAYLTNAVKHFKWTPRGKTRLHQKPDSAEVEACKPWLLAELSSVSPEILILLGATAARSLLGPGIKITRDRGLLDAPQLARRVVLTVHPSYLLRLPEADVGAERQRFIADLRLAGTPSPS